MTDARSLEAASSKNKETDRHEKKKMLTGLLRGSAFGALSAGAMGLLTCTAAAQTTAPTQSQTRLPPNQMTEGGLAEAAGGAGGASGITAAQVAITNKMLVQASTDEDNWLLYGRTYNNQRFSPLKQIDAQTVKNLVPVALISDRNRQYVPGQPDRGKRRALHHHRGRPCAGL